MVALISLEAILGGLEIVGLGGLEISGLLWDGDPLRDGDLLTLGELELDSL